MEQEEYDAERTAFFASKGYKVLRFWNSDVMNNIDSVLNVIWDTLNEKDKDKEQDPALYRTSREADRLSREFDSQNPD